LNTATTAESCRLLAVEFIEVFADDEVVDEAAAVQDEVRATRRDEARGDLELFATAAVFTFWSDVGSLRMALFSAFAWDFAQAKNLWRSLSKSARTAARALRTSWMMVFFMAGAW
jgi:hypothetical protein